MDSPPPVTDNNGGSNTTNNVPSAKEKPSKKIKQGGGVKCEDVIRKNLFNICKRMTDIESVSDYLFAEGAISEADTQRSQAEITTDGKVRVLMMAILRKGEYKNYEILHKALLNTQGNEHISNTLRNTENELANQSPVTEKKKRFRKKKGEQRKTEKMFTIYAPSDDETSESEDELNENTFFDTRTLSLFDLMVYMEWYLRTIKYHPLPLYEFSRFESTDNLVSAYPLKVFHKSVLRFKVDRSIFLKTVGFYGPANITIASYQIEMELAIQLSMDEKIIIGELSGIFEMKGNGSITDVSFEKSQPIRPHAWHYLTFTIKGSEKMAVQPMEKIVSHKGMKMGKFGMVVFDFDRSNSTGQIPKLGFYRGKDKIELEHFPRHNLGTVDDKLRLFTVQRFATSQTTSSVNPLTFNKSIQRFLVDRPIFLKSVGFFGPEKIGSGDESVVASYNIKIKVMAWKKVDEPIILQDVEELVEVRCGDLMYVNFTKASKITPHTWHWIEFTINGTKNIRVVVDKERISRVSVTYGNEIDDGGVAFEFNASAEHSTSPIRELRFYKANDASSFLGSQFFQLSTPDAQTCYKVERFSDENPRGSTVMPSKRFTASCQRFKVNRAIYLKKVGFFGPAASGVNATSGINATSNSGVTTTSGVTATSDVNVTSGINATSNSGVTATSGVNATSNSGVTATYEVKMKLVYRTIKTPPFVIATTEKVMEVEHGKLMYVSLETAQLIRPHIWHLIEFSIKGTEDMVVENKLNKKESVTVPYQCGGGVTFQFDRTPCRSTCQMPELWFYKGEKDIDLSRFPKIVEETPSQLLQILRNISTKPKCVIA